MSGIEEEWGVMCDEEWGVTVGERGVNSVLSQYRRSTGEIAK